MFYEPFTGPPQSLSYPRGESGRGSAAALALSTGSGQSSEVCRATAAGAGLVEARLLLHVGVTAASPAAAAFNLILAGRTIPIFIPLSAVATIYDLPLGVAYVSSPLADAVLVRTNVPAADAAPVVVLALTLTPVGR